MMRRVVATVCLLALYLQPVSGQKAGSNSIIGNWVAESDKKVTMVFAEDVAYQFYDDCPTDTFRYYIMARTQHVSNFGRLLHLVRFDGKDTATYEILALTDRYLSLLELKTPGKIMHLKRMPVKKAS